MQGPALLVIVRHAESIRNQVKKDTVYFADDAARRVVRGTPDHLVELTEAGHEQARQTGEAIRERFGVFDCVYTSGYARTEQTAERAALRLHRRRAGPDQVETNFYIRERDPGYTYDMTEAEAVDGVPVARGVLADVRRLLLPPARGREPRRRRRRAWTRSSPRSTASGPASAFSSSPTVAPSAACGSSSNGGSTRRCRSCCATIRRSTAVSPPTGPARGGRCELEDYNRVYWTVGSPEDGR